MLCVRVVSCEIVLERDREPDSLLSTERPGSLKYLKPRRQAFVCMFELQPIGMIRCLFPLLLISCQLANFASALPTLLNLTAESMLVNPQEDPEPHCAPNDQSTRYRLPFITDCIRAVRALPKSDYIGTFHIGGDASFWRLPVSRPFGSCKALVTLREDIDQDLGSWDDVRKSAARLLIACRKQYEPQGAQRTGGWITSGAENGVLIQLVFELATSHPIAVNGMETGTGQDTSAVEVQ